MNKYLFTALLLVCGGTLYAQEPPKKTKATAAAQAAAAQPKKAAKAAPVKPAAARPEELEAEESVVMIDSKPEAEEYVSRAAYGEEQEERAGHGGLPSSYGQCKGVITDAGRNILIFESPDDGLVSFVQVTVGKVKVSWKLVDRIPRSSD